MLLKSILFCFYPLRKLRFLSFSAVNLHRREDPKDSYGGER